MANAVAENGLNIDVITRLSGRVSLIDSQISLKACIQFSVSGKLRDPIRLRSHLPEISEQTGIDISFHVDNIYSHNWRLVGFDMDSTRVQAEVINILAENAGVGEQVTRIAETAMNGQMDFKESLARRGGQAE